jgi:DNA polymerase III epsilon subunit-like protein
MLVGHNIDFDKKVIGAELIRIDKDDTMEEFPSICTMKSTIDYCKIRNFFGYKYPSLQELYQKLFGCSFEGAHNSASDIDATFECFWELKKQKIIK